jgi:hypothetical protein
MTESSDEQIEDLFERLASGDGERVRASDRESSSTANRWRSIAD